MKVLNTTYEVKESKKGDLMFVPTHEVEGKEFPIREYVLFNHTGFALRKACEWWNERAFGEPPQSVEEAMTRLDDIKIISELEQEKDGDFWRVSSVTFASAVQKQSIEDDEVPDFDF